MDQRRIGLPLAGIGIFGADLARTGEFRSRLGWRGACLVFAAMHLLIALPLRVRATPAALVLRARSLSPEKPGEDPRVSAARTFCGVRGITVLNSAALLPNTVRFLTLIPRAKKALAQVRCPLTLVFFRRDETVRFSSARLALRLAPHAGIAALDGSSHFYFSPADQATMVSLVQHLIDAPASGA